MEKINLDRLLSYKLTADHPAVERLIEDWPDDTELVTELLAEAANIASPKLYVAKMKVDSCENGIAVIEGKSIASAHVADFFSKCDYVYPYIATSGVELGEWVRSKEDMIEQFIADKIAEIYLYVLMVSFKKAMIEEVIHSDKLAAVNPGSLKEWPISGQKELFALIPDASNETGVKLNDSFLMIPHKSGSGIYFISDVEYENCMLCPRTDCPNRRAEFNGNH